ncbi:neuromedin U [Bosea sp. Root381]|nr:neuromedin U [Bosea sp. Root381]
MSLLGMFALARAEESSSGDLAKAAQNPIANMISVPLQNNINFGVGPYSRVQNVLNIQPVIPISLGDDWNLITRWILPVISQPPLSIGGDREWGLGNANPSFFFSPKKPTAGIIWGIGPTVLLPTSTDRALGKAVWGAGPTAVALTSSGPWLIGTLFGHMWSFDGDHTVSLTTLQPFVNYNFSGGWYLTTSPIITADWRAKSNDRWTLPIGGGFGRVFKIGEQPVNMQLAAYYNAITPSGGASWQIRTQIQFLFPK